MHGISEIKSIEKIIVVQVKPTQTEERDNYYYIQLRFNLHEH
jgi:hypothetical protein